MVLRPGVRATVQDRGRPGCRAFGAPAGGAFDRESLDLANALVGNGPDAAAIELTMVGGHYRASHPLALALAGAPFEAVVRGRSGGERRVTVPQSFTLAQGEELVLGGSKTGLRAYLAVRGGWATPLRGGSRSEESPLIAGMVLPAEPGAIAVRHPIGVSVPDPTQGPIRVVDGPDGEVPTALLGGAYRVGGSSDRVGIRLEGPLIDGLDRPGRVSAPVAPGAVQVAGGRPMILGVAGGTMGGYPHVAHVVSADLSRLGQARPGDLLRFVRVALAEARRLDRERREEMARRDRWIALGARD